MAAKDFGAIESDYAFFMAHATEAERDAEGYVRELADFANSRATIRMLDFGCGGGDFTERLLDALNWPAAGLALTLFEPVASQRQAAALRLARYCREEVRQLDCLPDAPAAFDVIMSNHVLYYVDDLPGTLAELTTALAPQGKLLLAVAGWDNMLLQLWRVGFGLINLPVPYKAADDVADALAQLPVTYRRTAVPYELRFVDSIENRRRILRFLFAEYLPRMPERSLLAEFDRYARSGEIVVPTQSDHFVVTKQPSASPR